MKVQQMKPVNTPSGLKTISRTVKMPGGEMARVQVSNTGHVTWNGAKLGVFKGRLSEDKKYFIPYRFSDSVLLTKNFKRKRIPTLKNGYYYS